MSFLVKTKESYAGLYEGVQKNVLYTKKCVSESLKEVVWNRQLVCMSDIPMVISSQEV